MTREEFVNELGKLEKRICEDVVTSDDERAAECANFLASFVMTDLTEEDFPL